MAYVAMGSLHVTGAVAGENILEGLAINLSASGLHADLPTAMIAASGSRNVFVGICPPDQFPRPTPQGMFAYNWNTTIDPRDGVEFLVDSGQRGPYYMIGPSMLDHPTVLSGWKIQAHRGGAYRLTSDCFIDSSDIHNIGATVAVGAGGKFVYSTSNIVGYVREYLDGRLTIVLDPRSGA